MKQKILALGLGALMLLSLAACGQTADTNTSTSTPAGSSAPSSAAASSGGMGEGSTSEAGSASGEAAGLPTYSEQIKTQPSETQKNAALEELIVSTWGIPEEEKANTRYYYNYVDLDNDGTQEILAVAVGPYTSGTGGDSALIAKVDAKGNLTLQQEFTMFHEPIIIADGATNGYLGLVVPYYGGGAKSGYRVLSAGLDGQYPMVEEGEPLDSLDDISGTAIIYNDMAADVESGGLRLA